MKGIMLTLLAIATCIFLAISTFAQEVPQPPKTS